MGYTTEFEGAFTVSPPLSAEEVDFLFKFSQTRRMDREQGPYYVDDPHWLGGEGVYVNRPPAGQPGLWCQWEPSDDGTEIQWDGSEKAYDMVEWIIYLIDHFLRPGCLAASELPFLQANHLVNGVVDAHGEDPTDHWRIKIKDNVVTVVGLELKEVQHG